MVVSKFIRASLIGLTAVFSAEAMASDMGGVYSVELNKTEIVRLGEPASAVIIGNPKIADVSVHSGDTIFVVGRGYGQTNMIVLNAAGDTIVNSNIQVTSTNSAGSIRLYSGAERKSFSCAPYCLPAPVLGDSVEFIELNTPASPAISSNAISGSSGVSHGMVGVTMENDANMATDEFMFE